MDQGQLKMDKFDKWLPWEAQKYKVKDLFLGNRNSRVSGEFNNM
jgi:hypothetical protein